MVLKPYRVVQLLQRHSIQAKMDEFESAASAAGYEDVRYQLSDQNAGRYNEASKYILAFSRRLFPRIPARLSVASMYYRDLFTFQAGITVGYQEKPCLNPKDKECPNTAPNKNSSHVSKYGEEID